MGLRVPSRETKQLRGIEANVAADITADSWSPVSSLEALIVTGEEGKPWVFSSITSQARTSESNISFVSSEDRMRR